MAADGVCGHAPNGQTSPKWLHPLVGKPWSRVSIRPGLLSCPVPLGEAASSKTELAPPLKEFFVAALLRAGGPRHWLRPAARALPVQGQEGPPLPLPRRWRVDALTSVWRDVFKDLIAGKQALPHRSSTPQLKIVVSNPPKIRREGQRCRVMCPARSVRSCPVTHRKLNDGRVNPFNFTARS
jgi:hypothetical protein